MLGGPLGSRVLFATLITLIFTACIYYGFGYQMADSERPGKYAGIYRTDGHRHFSSLEPCGVNESWTLRGNTRRIQIEEEAVELGFLEPIYVELEGTLSAKGSYGHMNAFQRELTVTRVTSVGIARDETACKEYQTDTSSFSNAEL